MQHPLKVLAAWAVGLGCGLLNPLCGACAEPASPPCCEPADRLPACRTDPGACLDALKASPQGDPVELACSAEAACLAGKAGACGPLQQFLALPVFARDLRAHAAEFEAGCAAGQKGACTVVASELEARLKTTGEDEAPGLRLRWARALVRACAQGLGCAKVVAGLEQGRAGATADEESAAALETACKQAGDTAACAWVTKTYGNLGDAAERQAKCAAGVARACAAEAAEIKLAGGDPEPALTAACAAGDCCSCVLRLRDDNGRLKVAADHANAVTARAVCAKACGLGRLSACTLSHDMYVAGVGGARDEAGAAQARLSLCKLDSAACTLMARAWIVAPNLPEDADIQTRLAGICSTERDHTVREAACSAPADRAGVRSERVKCAGGDDATCLRLGRRLRDLSLHAQATDVLAGACDRGGAEACATLVDVRFRGLDLPPPRPEDAAKLKAAGEKACDGGSGAACNALAQAEEGQNLPHANKAMKWLMEDCKKGSGAACRMAADLCEGYGRKLPDNPKRAMSLRESGCKAGDAEACVAAGKQADEDSENPASGEVSGPLYLRACALGNADGCTRLQSTTPAPADAAAVLAAACKAGVLDVCGR